MTAQFERGEARLSLGREFRLDDELASQLRDLPGVTDVALNQVEPPRLALVS